MTRSSQNLIPRRRFLSGSLWAAGLALWPGALRARNTSVNLPAGFFGNLKLNMLELSHFEEFLGTRFTMEWQPGQIAELKLVEATLCGGRNRPIGDGGRAAFSLVFRGPATLNVEQKIYRLEHAKLGGLEIFLVPLGPDDHGMLLEAIFN